MAEQHTFDPNILREYDIRGIVGDSLTEDTAYFVARALGTKIRAAGGSSVCVGYDGRLTSPALEEAAVRGFVACGLVVHRIGMGPTPMLYFAVHTLDAGGGMMITGSHNPPDYNGFKMMVGKSAVYGEQIQDLGTIAGDGSFVDGGGRAEETSIFGAYLSALVEAFSGTKSLKVAWDSGNGAAGDVLRALVERLPGEHVLLFDEVDGTFPNHHPDPTVEANLIDLKNVVAENACDLGIAFDGDGDRIGVIDGQGRVLWGDQLMIILASDMLIDNPGATVIADVKASQVLFDEIKRMGGNPLMWKTGHSLVKAKMKEVGAPLAGEMSGHIFYGDRYYGFDDALYVAVRFLSILAKGGPTLMERFDAIPKKQSTPEVRIPCTDEEKFAIVRRISESTVLQDFEVSAVDGIRAQSSDGWWLLRASNTQPVLVARAESDTVEGLNNLKKMLERVLQSEGLSYTFD
ncbi:MAG: phosphomannomutase/phosphoglucomutase [Pseudomonadota bacterium]